MARLGQAGFLDQWGEPLLVGVEHQQSGAGHVEEQPDQAQPPRRGLRRDGGMLGEHLDLPGDVDHRQLIDFVASLGCGSGTHRVFGP